MKKRRGSGEKNKRKIKMNVTFENHPETTKEQVRKNKKNGVKQYDKRMDKNKG